MVELTGPIALKDNEKRIVYGPVLIPDEPDSDGDVVTASRVEDVAHAFTEKYGNVDLQHSLNNVGRLVESYILPVDMPVDNQQVIPKGTWMLGARVTDDDAWRGVKSGKYTGFSIMAVQGMAAAGKATKGQQRVTLADLGDDWIVNAVSLVDDPAVPRAKFLAIKSKNADNCEPVSLDQLENMLATTTKENDQVDAEQLKELLKEVLAEELNPMREQVNNIAQQMGDAEHTGDEDADNDRSESSEKDAGTGDAGQSDAGDAGDQGDATGDQDTSNADQPDQDDAGDAGDQADTTTSQDDAEGDGPALTAEEQAQLKQLLAALQEQETTEDDPAPTKAGKSSRLAGQDHNGNATKSEDVVESDRDAFGRKKR